MAEHLLAINHKLKSPDEALSLFGSQDAFLHLMEKDLGISLITRGETIYVSGNDETFEIADRLLGSLLTLIRKGIEISERDVLYAVKMAKKDELDYFESMYEEEITKTAKGKPIRVKTLGQREYVAAMKKNDMVFGTAGGNRQNLFGGRKSGACFKKRPH